MLRRAYIYTSVYLSVSGAGLILAALLNALRPDVIAGIVAIAHGYAVYSSGYSLQRGNKLILTASIIIFISFIITVVLMILSRGS